MPKPEIIKDPLSWQNYADGAGGAINNLGAKRQRQTIEHHLGTTMITNGSPEFTAFILQLSNDIWLSVEAVPVTDFVERVKVIVAVEIETRFISTSEAQKKYPYAFKHKGNNNG